MVTKRSNYDDDGDGAGFSGFVDEFWIMSRMSPTQCHFKFQLLKPAMMTFVQISTRVD